MSALRLQLLAAPSAQKRRTASPAAYTEYLLGRQFFHLNNPAAFGRSVQAYEKSVALDAGYAPAWAGLALARFWFGQEAVALSPELPAGYLARGTVRALYLWDWGRDGRRRRSRPRSATATRCSA